MLSFTKSKKKSVLDNKFRQIEGIQLNMPSIDNSYHSSVVQSSRNSSIRNIVNSSYFQSQVDWSRNQSFQSSKLSSRVLPQLTDNRQISRKNSSRSLFNTSRKSSTVRSISSKQSQISQKLVQKAKKITLQDLFSKYFDTDFVQSLIQFINKDWEEQETLLLKEKRFEALKNAIIQKTNIINSLVEQFLLLEYPKYDENQRQLVMSLLFKMNNQVMKQYESMFIQILKRIPEEKILKQESEIEDLYRKLIQIYDPKYITSNEKMKERSHLFMEGYTVQKNNLIAELITKLKPQVNFMCEVEDYLIAYQKQLIKVRNQFQASELEKNKVTMLLKKKANFTPIQIDFDRLKSIKDQSQKEFFNELEGNYIKFHQQQHNRQQKSIKQLNQQNESLRMIIEDYKLKVENLQKEIQSMINSIPKKQDRGVQVYFFSQNKAIEGQNVSSPLLANFLSNISTPFNFTQKITSSLISLISIDKVLHDYESMRNKVPFERLNNFVVNWFLTRTGTKRIAQIFTKNFMYSVKEFKNKHKRFHNFARMCGFNGLKKKSVIDDLTEIYFSTQKAWYLWIKLCIFYRNKLSDNHSGFHLLPPISCEAIFKLSLRKVYELVEEFLVSENYQVPQNLQSMIDFYSINQISKFKSHDEQFQKGQLQQIHILRQINLDIIAGFVIQYIANERCGMLQKLLRAIHIKQKQLGNALGFSEFEHIYKQFYKEKRAKIQIIFSKICFINQYDMLDIENSQTFVRAVLEDEAPLRNMFDEIQTFKVLILPMKSNLRSQKMQVNPNTYEKFRERYYLEFYDFYSTTSFLEEVYKVIKVLIKKKLKSLITNEEQIEKLIEQKQPLAVQSVEEVKQEEKQEQQSLDEEESNSSEQKSESKLTIVVEQQRPNQVLKSQLQQKIEEWSKIVVRIPHFSQRILTIQQMLVNHVRRKAMIEASQFAWRTLRDILIIISKQ